VIFISLELLSYLKMDVFSHEPLVIGLAILGAVIIGFAKTGIAGLGILVAAIFAMLMPAKQASGFVLPMLIFGDMVAVTHYRMHADWKQVFRLLPWTVPGIICGTFALGRLDDLTVRKLIAALIVVLVLWQAYRRWRAKPTTESTKHSLLLTATLGFLVGFTTLVANAAGPIMALYLLAVGLPKMNFMGTTAVFFFVLNLFKVPFMQQLGLISWDSFKGNLVLLPAVLFGTWLGKRLLLRISQQWFERVALVLSAAAAVKLLM
jgi:uncharacterized protein